MFLLNDLLDLSKMEAGKMDYDMEQTDLISLAEDSLSDFSTTIEEKRISAIIEKPDFQVMAMCDRYKIGQVIRNLISNATKYSEENEKIVLRFSKGPLQRANPSVQGLVVSVLDSGVGIAETELDLVFDKFSQGSKTKDGSGGTGLGLSISKQIVTDHNGEIWVEPGQKKGTTIHFTLPCE